MLEERGDASGEQNNWYSASASFAAEPISCHHLKSFFKSSAAGCAQVATDPALRTRVAERRLNQNSTEPEGSEADHETETFSPSIASVRGAAPSELKSYAFPTDTCSSMERQNARQFSEGPQFAVAKQKVEDAKQNQESKPVQNQQGKDKQQEGATIKERSQPANQRFNADGTKRKRGKKKNPNRKRGGVKKRRCKPKKKEIARA